MRNNCCSSDRVGVKAVSELTLETIGRNEFFCMTVLQERGHPFMTSARRGGGVGLRWTHVNEEGGQLHVDVHTEH